MHKNKACFQGVAILILVCVNVFLTVFEECQRRTEMRSRLTHVLGKLSLVAESELFRWAAHNFPHPHTPLSASVVLQWAYRDGGVKVNVPWALLARGDVILIKPGQVRGLCFVQN